MGWRRGTSGVVVRGGALVGAGVGLALGLVGCIPGGSASTAELPVFAREQTDTDLVPGGSLDGVEVDAASTRLVWSDDDFSFYAAKGAGGNAGRTCLVMVETYGGTGSGCSDGLPVTIGLEGEPTYRLGGTESYGGGSGSGSWTELADSFWVETPAS